MDLVSTLIEKLGQKYLKTYSNFMSVQRNQLQRKQESNYRNLRRSLKGTQIYKDFRLEHIETYQDFVNHVPVWEYEDYASYADRVIAGGTDVLFKDAVDYIGLSSGTSGKDSKRIPYNESMIQMFLKFQKRVASRLSVLEPQTNFLQTARLTFGSEPFLYADNGLKFGYISGILSTRVPKALLKNTFPSQEVLFNSNWDEKIDALIEEAIHQDIEIVSGIPTYLISIFEAVLKKTGQTSINQIWPNLKYVIYAATPIKQYKERLDRLVGHELTYYGVYASTEAAIGFPYSAYENGRQLYLLNPDLLYTFTPVAGPELHLGLHEIEMGVNYYINIGTPNGFIHYSMKDIVQFSEINSDLVFEFVTRKSTGINLASEKISNETILDCFLATKDKSNLDLRHYFLSPTTNDEGKPSYLWTVFLSDACEVREENLAKTFDQEMLRLNGDYVDFRAINIIGPAQVKIVDARHLQSYFEKNRSRGQFKLKTTFETAEEYLQFMKLNIEEKTNEVVQ